MSNRRKTTRDRLNQQLNNNDPQKSPEKHFKAKKKVELMDRASTSHMYTLLNREG